MRWGLALPAVVAAAVCSVAAGATSPYTLSGPKTETSAWPTPASGVTWGGGAGSVSETSQTSAYSGGKPNTATYTWKLPTSIPADGAKGSITVNATAGSEVFAPGFGINGVLVGCTGITNTPSYGTGCADGDHAAAAVSLQPGQSKTVTQEFLVKPGIGQVTVVIPGYAQQFVYTSTSNAATTTTTTASAFANVHYSISGVYSHDRRNPQVLGLIVRSSGSFEAVKGKSDFVRGNRGTGTAEIIIHETSGRHVVELTEDVSEYEAATANYPPAVRLYYKVTSSTLPCLRPGKSVRIIAEQGRSSGGGSDKISIFVCGLHPIAFSTAHEQVNITAH